MFNNKKIGIWGFGVVGKSAYNYLQQFSNQIQVLDKTKQELDCWIEQTDQSIISFLEHNDIILCSPGIKLHNYKQYHHKIITELDIFIQAFTETTIAITGTLGKTSITNLFEQYILNSIAAGNIGYPMLNILMHEQQPKSVILELSSFQLQHTKQFVPDIAIWTNFYPNHLDHHKSEQEYFEAKCNLFKQQTNNQIALLPCNLIERIQDHIATNATLFLFCTQNCITHNYPTFTIDQKNIYLDDQIIFKNIDTLPSYTFHENWLMVIATLYLQNIPFNTLKKNLIPQEHRLEKLGTYKGTTFHNDSKSTVWQATKQAIDALNDQSCALFLGGLSKGSDRTPLIKYLQNKPISVFAFGQEAHIIQNLCDQYSIPCQSYQTLDQALKSCLKQPLPQNILLSPAGASFDLFINYVERGNHFKRLVNQLIQ